MDELKLIGAAFAEPTPEAAAEGRDHLLRLTREARTAQPARARRSWPATLPIRRRSGDAHRRHRRRPGESGGSDPRTPAYLIAAPPADARTLLIRAASAAAQQPDPVPARHQYVRTKTLAQRSLYTKDESGRTLHTKVPVSEERWEAADLDKPWLSRSRNPPATGPARRRYWDRSAEDIVS